MAKEPELEDILKDNKEKDKSENGKQKVEESALLNILKEKDKLIVSLKEASTKRDKLNEKQIMMLSEDNNRKELRIKEISFRISESEKKLTERENELENLRTTSNKITSTIDSFKLEFSKYKSTVKNSIDQLKLAIQEEMGKNATYNNQLLRDLKDRYLQLETKLQEVDNHYLNVISEISRKQGLAKKNIRHAMNDLQEALSLLDIAHAEFIKPTDLKEDFSKIFSEADDMFKKHKAGIAAGGGGSGEPSTIVKNIENVNIQLGEHSEIESIFGELSTLSGSLAKPLDISGSGGAPVQAKSKVQPSQATRGDAAESAGQKAQKPGAKGKGDSGDDDGSGGKAGGGGAGGETGTGGGGSSSTGAAPSGAAGGTQDSGGGTKEDSSQASAQEIGSMSASAGSGGQGSLAATKLEATFGEDAKIETEGHHEVIVQPGKNYAPYNWGAILNDARLKRFGSIIRSCIKYQKEEKWMKALDLFKTVREQPSIQKETITAKLLDDHINYLEALVKFKYSTQEVQ